MKLTEDREVTLFMDAIEFLVGEFGAHNLNRQLGIDRKTIYNYRCQVPDEPIKRFGILALASICGHSKARAYLGGKSVSVLGTSIRWERKS